MLVAILLVGPGTIAWAIVRYQFLDIGLLARRSLVYSITTTVVVGGYLLVVVQSGTIIRSIIGQESQILSALVVIVLLFFFQPIYNQVDDFVRKIFIRTKADLSQLIENFSREILAIFQADKLAATISDTLRREMFIEKVEICFTDAGGRFEIALPADTCKALDIELAISTLLLTRRAPTFTEEFASKTQTGHLGAEMIARGFVLVVPLVRHDKLAGLLMLSAKVAGFRYSSEDLTFLTILANQILVAMENAELYAEALEKQRMEEELTLAKQIQTGLLPKKLPALKAFDFAAYIEPSRQVGGDFYDFIPIRDGRLGIVIADASGKGVPAALLIARMQVVFQTEARLGKGVHEIMNSVNRFISESTSPDRFATCFYAELDEHSCKLHYCNAGHNYPLIVKKGGKVEPLIKGGLLLGAFADSTYESATAEMCPGDTLILYTDGLTEMMDSAEQEYGEARLTEQASMIRHLSSEEICAGLIEAVKAYASGPNEIDDMTLVVMKARDG
jgi:phosphoserine phosphatase RsbU/P